jgi:hypothetical protein
MNKSLKTQPYNRDRDCRTVSQKVNLGEQSQVFV